MLVLLSQLLGCVFVALNSSTELSSSSSAPALFSLLFLATVFFFRGLFRPTALAPELPLDAAELLAITGLTILAVLSSDDQLISELLLDEKSTQVSFWSVFSFSAMSPTEFLLKSARTTSSSSSSCSGLFRLLRICFSGPLFQAEGGVSAIFWPLLGFSCFG